MSDDLNDRIKKLQARRNLAHGEAKTARVGDPIASPEPAIVPTPTDTIMPSGGIAVPRTPPSAREPGRGKRRKPAEATRILTVGVASSASLMLINLMAAHAPVYAVGQSAATNNASTPNAASPNPSAKGSAPGSTATSGAPGSTTATTAPRSGTATSGTAAPSRPGSGTASAPAPAPAPAPTAAPSPKPTAAPPPVTQAPPPPTTAAPPPTTAPTKTCPSGQTKC